MDSKDAARLKAFVERFRVEPGRKVELKKDYDPGYTAGLSKPENVDAVLGRAIEFIAEHQDRLYAESKRGLLIILDHGNGYLSLYGHNEQLFKQAGATVQAGEAIATAGDSGGRSRPGLYFEIRRAGKPVNPSGWFKSPAPPPG